MSLHHDRLLSNAMYHRLTYEVISDTGELDTVLQVLETTMIIVLPSPLPSPLALFPCRLFEERAWEQGYHPSPSHLMSEDFPTAGIQSRVCYLCMSLSFGGKVRSHGHTHIILFALLHIFTISTSSHTHHPSPSHY